MLRGINSWRKLFAIWLIAVQGAFVLIDAMAPGARAADSGDSFSISIGLQDIWVPARVADLGAVQGAEGQALLMWTAPDENNDGFAEKYPVASYVVKIATFSVDSLAADTTAWWNLASDVAGEPVPLPPGNPQTMLLNGLIPGGTYFFAIRGLDDAAFVSPIDTGSADPGQQANVRVTDLAPGTPQNFAAISADAQVLLGWTDLTPLEKTLDFSHYRLERSTDGVNFIPVTTTTAVSYLDTGVVNGAAYTYQLTAVDDGSVGAALESAPAVVAAMPQFSTLPPAIVSGLSGQLSEDGQFFTINWATVTTNLDGTPLTDLAGYRVLKSSSPFVSTTAVFNVLQSTFTDTVNNQEFYYRVRAVDLNGNESPDSIFVNSSPNPSVTVVCDDGQTSLTIPGEIGMELNKENNSTGSDLVIVPVRVTAEEKGNVLKSYNFEVRRAENNQAVTSFAFSRPLVDVTFGFGGASGVGPLGLAARKMSVHWYNGARFISLGADIDFQAGTASVLSANPGKYQLRTLSGAIETILTEGSPYPRTITPNGDGINDRVFFFFEATDALKEGKIFDLNGAFVGKMTPGPVMDSSLVWDGKDDRGNVVSRGIYIYKVSLGDKSTTGTVVVAR